MATTNQPNTNQTNADAERLLDALRDAMSPGAVAAIATGLNSILPYCTGETEDARQARDQVRWLRDLLFNDLGIPEYNRLAEEIGF